MILVSYCGKMFRFSLDHLQTNVHFGLSLDYLQANVYMYVGLKVV
jgi:hypothetical protein